MKTFSRLCAVFGLLALLGAGCAASDSSPSANTASTPSRTSFDTLSPADAAKHLNFIQGDVIVMRQGFSGLASSIADKLGFAGTSGTRTVVIREFAPEHKADIEWKLSSEVKTGTSTTQGKQITGAVLGANLLTSHTLFLPAAWPEGDRGAFESSTVWLSSDVYQDLSRNKTSTLNFGLNDDALTSTLSSVSDFKAALSKLNIQVKQQIDHKDLYVITAENAPSTWTLKINGKDVKVQVLKAHSWFGDLVILDNSQNPLILKVTVNPLYASFNNYLGYEVTEIRQIL